MELVVARAQRLSGVGLAHPGVFVGGVEDMLLVDRQGSAFVGGQEPGSHPDPDAAHGQGRGQPTTVPNTSRGQDRHGVSGIDRLGQ